MTDHQPPPSRPVTDPSVEADTTDAPSTEVLAAVSELSGSELSGAGQQPSSSSRLISATALMATGTMLSRILGFFRVALISYVLGNARQADMFNLANTVPNMIYILLAGGALNTVLVPQVVRAIKHDPDGGEAYTNRILTAGLLIIAALTTVATLLAPLIIRLYTSSSWKEPAVAAQYDSIIMLAYLCLPQIFFYGAHVLIGQVLNARDKFGPMMFAPIANNIVSILIFVLYLVVWGQGDGHSAFTTRQELVLGLGSTLGIAVQAAVLVPFMRSAGFRYRPRFDLRGTGLGRTFSLAKWTLGFVIATQIAVVVVTRLASGATAGDTAGAGVTVYNNAYLLWILPHSLITVSLATAMLPQASRLAAEGDLLGVTAEATKTMRIALTIVLPSAVAFLALAQPMAMVLFGNGLGEQTAGLIGWTLMGFAIGLVPFTLHYICLRVFYALEDTRSTFLLQCMVSGANIVLALAFVLPIGLPTWVAPGLAIAYALAYVFGLLIAFRWLQRKIPGLSFREIVRHGVRLFIAVAPAGIAAAAISWAFSLWSDSQLIRVAGLAAAGLAALGIFFLLARVFHISEVNDILRTLLRRGSRAKGGEGGDSAGQIPNSGPGGDSSGPMQPSSHTIESGTRPDNGSDEPGGVSTTTNAGPGMPDGSEDASDQLHQSDSTRGAETTQDGSATSLTSSTSSQDPASPAPMLEAGALLGGRYRLEDILAEVNGIATWRAQDRVLSRSVLIHVLAAGDERAPELLSVARQAAAATDSRFLRILDAVPSPEAGQGSYIVCEYAVGQSLEQVLASGPLSGLEAAWLVREVADALSGVHAQALFHQRISPDTVIITPTGNVKIVGLLIEAALRSRPDVAIQSDFVMTGADDPESIDVLDLGRLLYATLVCRWPGGPAYGLADAPASGHRWMTPRQVRAGVAPVLDGVCDQILGDPPRHRAPLIGTANDVVNALTKVLGAADASTDLERRLRQPLPLVGAAQPEDVAQPEDDGGPVTEEMSIVDLPHPGSTPMRHSSAGSPSTRITPPVPPTTTASAATSTRTPHAPRTPHSPQTGAQRTAAPVGGGATPRTGGAGTPPAPPHRRRRWVAVVIGLLAVLAVTALLLAIFVFNPMAGKSKDDKSPAATAPAKPTKLKIVTAEDFDPEQTGAGPKTENPDEVPLAYDGDPETRWRTLSYKGNPKFGNLKQGLGLVLDLGEAKTLSSVKLKLSGNGTSLEARIPKDNPDTRESAPMTTADRWRSVAKANDVGQDVTLKLKEPSATRFVLVYLTSLPREGQDYRGGIYEVEVYG